MAAILAQNDELETGKRALAERLSAHEAAAASHQTELDAMAATQAALRCDREAIARGLAAAQQEAARRRREEASLKERNAGLAEQIALDSEQLGRLRQASHEDAKVKTTVQDIIYDIEREARQEIGRLKAENVELRRCILANMQQTADLAEADRAKSRSTAGLPAGGQLAMAFSSPPRPGGGGGSGVEVVR